MIHVDLDVLQQVDMNGAKLCIMNDNHEWNEYRLKFSPDNENLDKNGYKTVTTVYSSFDISAKEGQVEP